MVGDLQDLAAADAAALHLTRQTCDLAELAAAAADSLARLFDAADIAVDRQLAAAPILADPRWLHRVITNLLSNALKFTPSGGRVTISTRQEDPEAVLEVTDTGSGIPADELPHVFDRFWRGRQAAQTSGSGIGLSVAADLARAHGGRLSRGQPARARHDHDAHPAWRLTSRRPSQPPRRRRAVLHAVITTTARGPGDRDRPPPDAAALAAAHPGDRISLTIKGGSPHLIVQVRPGELPWQLIPAGSSKRRCPRPPYDRHSKGTRTPPRPAWIRS